jgi:hypothetical protein
MGQRKFSGTGLESHEACAHGRFWRCWRRCLKAPGMRKVLAPLVYVAATLLTAPLTADADPREGREIEAAATTLRGTPYSLEMSDEAAMVLLGTALIGLAAVVRRAA